MHTEPVTSTNERTDPLPSPDRARRRRVRTWGLAVPAVIVLVLAGVFVWGELQPKPEGYAAGAAATGDRWVRFTVDATSREEWVLFDFERGEVIAGDLTSPNWDLAFRRTKILTNSGVTNPAGVGGAFDLGEVALDEATPPATAAFEVDRLGGDDEDEPDNPAIGGWYSYSFVRHVVSVKPNTYLVRTGGDLDALVQFDSYYCENEDPGCVTFRYRLVPKVPDGEPARSS